MRAQVFYGLTVLRATSLIDEMDKLGVPRPDLEKLVGGRLWLSSDRHIVRRALDSMMFGSLDMLGISRFEFSAQWIATWIALVVHPANHLIACAWYHGAQSADSLISTPESIPISEGISASELFQHVQEAYAAIEHQHSNFHQDLQDSIVQGRKRVEAEMDHGAEA